MILKKYLNIFLIFFSIFLITTWSVVSSADEPCSYHGEAYEGLELSQLSQELKSTGLIGRVHGAASTAQLFVMSVREPENFFSHREFSLVPGDERAQTVLSQVSRHDLICIKGDFLDNPSPQKHVWVSSAEVLEPWPQQGDLPPYERSGGLPAELASQTELVGKVHAIGEAGKVLVVEYKGGVLPIFVEATDYTEGLFRGDIVRVNYTLQERPQQPTHLKLNLESEQPIEVLDAIASWHQQEKTLAGKLVKFPQSPQLKFDVYAIEVETLGVKRTFTLVNFDDIDAFNSIRERLAALWDTHLATAVSGRNMQINPDVIVEASGRLNVVSPEQANPQILLNSAEDIRLETVD